ncbi:MAG: DUF4258 domain-containing protein [Mesorhizobium sp.]|uniref:DUF4258 domain-containing protein n=1 Tax=Mesorhizobium sp. TaxID=1871066 RepID=UPI000F7647E9|nr:DUF4258 domain-containing protein [Mesorhizobium sp. M1D.F.Ca.ET.043.01.1.1]RWA94947.1 MAG: DUF4258 domain-containing protein [Mesorhizobium sp.]RWE17658.1 MAG: DUF4258 domain-containing protein [Mesorhizobium sp.]TJW89849.1 MAG: DUF4258 domain-containing protein [Mesorhizobium sp.]
MLEFSDHAHLRMRQRGIRPAEVQFVIENGTETAHGFLLSEHDFEKIEAEAKHQIDLAQRLRGVFVPVSGKIVKTVFKSSRKQQRRFL